MPGDTLQAGAGLLIIRLILGLVMAGHGAQKLFGWFGGHGLVGTAGFFDSIGFRPGRPMAAMAAGTEVASGLLVAGGLFGPVGPALMVSVMIVAASVHWSNGLFATSNGIELPLIYAAAGVALALTGPGRLSLDVLLGLQTVWTPVAALIALGAGFLGGIGNLLVRRAPAAA